MMMKNVAFIGAGIMAISAILLGTSCIDEYVQDPETQQTGILVIEGTITGDTATTFYVSRTVRMEQTATTASPEQGAEVSILCDDGTQSAIAFEADSGQYIIHHHALDANKKYCVQVKTGGKTYLSEFMRPLQTPPIDSLYWYKENTEAPVDILLSTHDPNNQVNYYMWTFREDWEIVPAFNTTQYATGNYYDNIHDYEVYPNPYYYCWNRMISRNIILEEASRFDNNHITDYPIHTFSCSDHRLSYLYCITVSQLALSTEAYQYYSNKKEMTEEMGSIFAPMPSELKGNITCLEYPEEEVIGFIHVATPTTKRLFITREEAYLDNEDCHLFTKPELAILLNKPISILEPSLLLALGYRYVYNGAEGIPPERWARMECVECTAKGTKEKPDFWPNDHE